MKLRLSIRVIMTLVLALVFLRGTQTIQAQPQAGRRAAPVAASEPSLAVDLPVLPGMTRWTWFTVWADYTASFDYVIDLMPSVSYKGHQVPSGTATYSPASHSIRWYGTVLAGQTLRLDFAMGIPCAADGTDLGSWTADGYIGSSPGHVTSGRFVVRWPDLSTSYKSAPSTAQVGDEIDYVVTLYNDSQVTAQVVASDTVPSGVSVVAFTKWASEGEVSRSGNQMLWEGEIEAEGEVQFGFTVRVLHAGTIVNTVVINQGVGHCSEPITIEATTVVGTPDTPTPSRTATRTHTATLSPTATRTPTATDTRRPTWTRRPTRTSTPTRTPTPTAIPCADLIVNGGFEQGLTGWWAWAADGNDQAPWTNGSWVASGAQSAVVGAAEGAGRRGTCHLAQDVVIPANMQDVWLHYDYAICSDEPREGDVLFDWFQLQILDARTGAVLLTDGPVGKASGWTHRRLDLNPFVGRWLRLHFVTFNDGWLPTHAHIDGVHLCDGVEAEDPPPTPGFVFKDPYGDYAPSGVPDFDQRQAGWDCPPGSGEWAYCGPLAAANSLWWFDSKFEPQPQPPNIVNDNYGLLQPYGPWDDHDARNVRGFVEELAQRMDCCGLRTNPYAWSGTYVNDLRDGIVSLLRDRGVLDDYTVTLRMRPSFDWVAEEIERCEDVILLVGFYQPEGAGWNRVGGHFVTCAGVDIAGRRLAISDPIRDASVPTGDWTAHNDAAQVSHDIYRAVASDSPGGTWALAGYADLANPRYVFRDAPMPPPERLSSAMQGIVTEVEGAVAVSPVADDADEQPAPPEVDMLWKGLLEAYIDYAPEGVPDFSQLQAPWWNPRTGAWSWDGPVAVANSLWWFDSKFEPRPVAPPEINDNYRLVEAYDPRWDDHDWRNVDPFVADLAQRMDTDGRRTGAQHVGTGIEEMTAAVREYLEAKNLVGDYTVTLRQGPDFDWVRGEIERCEDVILLLGFWEMQADGWKRLGGHYVTATGVGLPLDTQRIGIADPFRDIAEEGFPGRVAPPPPHDHPVNPPDTVHNNAGIISHEVYRPVGANVPKASFALQNYVRSRAEVEPFLGQNVPDDLQGRTAARYNGGDVVAAVDYALAVSPHPDAVTIYLSPGHIALPQGKVYGLGVYVDAGAQPLDTVEFHLDFDPALVRVVDEGGQPASAVTPGTDLSMVLFNTVDAGAGGVSFAATSPGANLTGRVLVAIVHFEALAPTAGTPITFSWLVPRRTDVLLSGNSVLGEDREATLAIEAGVVSLKGSVRLQGRPNPPDDSWKVPLAVTVFKSGGAASSPMQSGDTYGRETTGRGNFAIDDLPVGTYDVAVKSPHTLRNLLRGLQLGPDTARIDFGELVEGDVDNDNAVTTGDVSALSGSYGKSQGDPGYDARADLDGDGVVGDADLNLVRVNIGRVGDLLLPGASAPSGHAFGQALASAGDATLRLVADRTGLRTGETVTVDIVVDGGSHAVDAAEAHLLYDRQVLQCVTAAGGLASTLEAGTTLPLVLINAVDTTAGRASFGAADLSGAGATGTFTLARARFRALRDSTRVELRLDARPGYRSDVSADGESVLGAVEGVVGVVGPTATPAGWVRLPLVWKG